LAGKPLLMLECSGGVSPDPVVTQQELAPQKGSTTTTAPEDMPIKPGPGQPVHTKIV
jgi:hypothetical protein